LITIILQSLLALASIALTVLLLRLSVRFFGFYAPEDPSGTSLSRVGNRKHLPSESPNAPVRAIILCNHVAPASGARFQATGFTDCRTLHRVFGGNLKCSHGCLGLGSCATVCPTDAILIGKTSIHISDACTGCGRCLSACPLKLILLQPASGNSSWTCAAGQNRDEENPCQTARSGYTIDSAQFSPSGFQILNKWGILKKNRGSGE
jgi:Predicted NADH:ubiquinone oxidoreductase, subunit RnfB